MTNKKNNTDPIRGRGRPPLPPKKEFVLEESLSPAAMMEASKNSFPPTSSYSLNPEAEPNLDSGLTPSPVVDAPPTIDDFEKEEPPQRGNSFRMVTNEHKKYIRRYMNTISVDRLAEKTGLTAKMIMGAIQEIQRNAKREADELKNREIINNLMNKAFFSQLKRQFSSNEMEFFKREWVDCINQFNSDLLPTEESELKDMIVFEIMKHQALQRNMDLKLKYEQLNRTLAKVEAMTVPDFNLLTQIRTQMEICERQSSQNMSHFKDLTQKSMVARESLAASRQQRINVIQDARANFTEWLRAIQEHEIRTKIAREMELLKMAVNKEEGRLGSFTVFPDQKVDIALLNSETVFDKQFDENQRSIDKRPTSEDLLDDNEN